MVSAWSIWRANVGEETEDAVSDETLSVVLVFCNQQLGSAVQSDL